MGRCISSARYTMKADVLRNGKIIDSSVPLSEQGEHRYDQDPDTGEIIRKWVPVTDDSNPDDIKQYSVNCIVEGVTDGGIRVAGTTERFEKTYENIDIVFMHFPANVILTKRDQITNVRDARTGYVIWSDEELDAENGIYPPTLFDVLGVTPLVVMGRHYENKAMLARVDNYGSE